MIYNKITEFCKIRNNGNCFKNGSEPTPRVKFLTDLLDSEGIEYELDIFEQKREPPRQSFISKFKPYRGAKWLEDDDTEEEQPKNLFYNIVMKGTSNKMIIAHHDVNNHTIDNANDNSASCINVIAAKKLKPEINAVLVDGEEFGGIGSSHLGKQIIAGKFGDIEWVLNLELSGKGGKYFFIGEYPGPLYDRIKELFDCPTTRTPFNDSVTLRRFGIDSTVINPAPPLQGKKSDLKFPVSGEDGVYLDFSIVFNCHRPSDTLASISATDMKEFVEQVVIKIIS